MSRAVGRIAHTRLPSPIGRLSVRAFARAYDIDVGEAERPIGEYAHVGAFFTRRLRPGARPVDRRPSVAVSPADGHLLNAGRIMEGRLIQAKGRLFTVDELLSDHREADAFRGGSWATIYLSPRDYHRVHFPVEGRVVASHHVPGQLWPVNRAAVRHIDQLFCVNERLTTYIDSPIGRVAVTMVGATSVGHITSAYDEELVTNHGPSAGRTDYAQPTQVARGDELGVFNLGSTVIVLFADPGVALSAMSDGQPIRMGTAIARRNAVQ